MFELEWNIRRSTSWFLQIDVVWVGSSHAECQKHWYL